MQDTLATLARRAELERVAQASSSTAASAAFARAASSSITPALLPSSVSAAGAALAVERLDPRQQVGHADRLGEYSATLEAEDALWRKLSEVAEEHRRAEREAAATAALLDRKERQVDATRRELLVAATKRGLGADGDEAFLAAHKPPPETLRRM